VRAATADVPTGAWTATGWTVPCATGLATKRQRLTEQCDARASLPDDNRWHLRHRA
jgi:hypothetical protein